VGDVGGPIGPIPWAFGKFGYYYMIVRQWLLIRIPILGSTVTFDFELFQIYSKSLKDTYGYRTGEWTNRRVLILLLISVHTIQCR